MGTYFNINYELSIPEVHRRIDEQLLKDEAGYICVADGNILQMVHKDTEYRNTVNGGMFSICDSSWVPLYLKRLYGMKVDQYCGSQIFEDILRMKKYRMLFMGASQEVLDALKANITEKYDARISEMTFMELPFKGVDEFDYKSIAETINRDNPDIIWLALGAPKQEIFASRLTPYLNRGVVIPVGAVFKFYSGVGEKRAPTWAIRTHTEWLFRILREPKKQTRRCWNIIRTLPKIYLEEKRKAASGVSLCAKC